MDTLSDLDRRTGLPDALCVLLRDYPRDLWQSHAQFDGLIRFWLDRHALFRTLLGRLDADVAFAAGFSSIRQFNDTLRAVFAELDSPPTDNEADTAATAPATPSIVFIYTDSILANYNVFQEKGAALARREQEENAKLQEKGRAIEQEVRSIQSQVQQGLLAPNQIARERARFLREKQDEWF